MEVPSSAAYRRRIMEFMAFFRHGLNRSKLKCPVFRLRMILKIFGLQFVDLAKKEPTSAIFDNFRLKVYGIYSFTGIAGNP